MTATTPKPITLSSADEAYVEAQVDAGAFRDAADVVRAGLALLQQKTLSLRDAIAAGDADIAAGRTTRYFPGELSARLRHTLEAEAPAPKVEAT